MSLEEMINIRFYGQLIYIKLYFFIFCLADFSVQSICIKWARKTLQIVLQLNIF